MMFNFGGKSNTATAKTKTSQPITIKVKGSKDIVLPDNATGVNLRKVLMDNKVEVYPLQAKLLGKHSIKPES